MGNCVCLQDRAVNSKFTETDGNELSGSGNRVPTNLGSTTTEARIPQTYKQKSFTLDELKDATEEFSSTNVLGKGGFGTVFKGWIDEHTLTPRRPSTGMPIAVKMLEQGSIQGHKQWTAEVETLEKCDHPNLIKLIGHCSENNNLLLVYEFMPGGSLDMHLFRKDYQPLYWAIRLKIALEAAKGLAYLHSKNILFRDIKCANVLLDTEYNAKLSDFGLARAGPAGDRSHVSTNPMGTVGYIDPHYIQTGHASVKTDVYSFGILLVEMLTGEKVSNITETLAKLMKPGSSSKTLLEKMDTRMGPQYSRRDGKRACLVAHRCLYEDTKKRPTMDDVVCALEVIHKTAGVAGNPDDPRSGQSDVGPSGSK